MAFGDRLKELRKTAGMSEECLPALPELARRQSQSLNRSKSIRNLAHGTGHRPRVGRRCPDV